jgi:flagellin
MTEINFNVSNLNIIERTVQSNRSPKLGSENFQASSLAQPSQKEFVVDPATMRIAAGVGDLESSTSQVNSALTVLETTDSSSQKIIVALRDMRELASQAAEESMSTMVRAEMDREFGALFNQIIRLATDMPHNESLRNSNKDFQPFELRVSNLSPKNNFGRPLGAVDKGTLSIPIKSWDPTLASRSNAIQQTVDPVTGLQLIAGNQFTPDGLIAGGNDLILGDPAMLDYDLSGNDDSIARGAPYQSARSTETQAFGSAVLYTGNASSGDGNPSRINILSKINAEYVLANIDKAISAASDERARLSAYIDKLEVAVDHLTKAASGKHQSLGRIEDADFAVETSESSRNQIISREGSGLSIQGDATKHAILEFLMR